MNSTRRGRQTTGREPLGAPRDGSLAQQIACEPGLCLHRCLPGANDKDGAIPEHSGGLACPRPVCACTQLVGTGPVLRLASGPASHCDLSVTSPLASARICSTSEHLTMQRFTHSKHFNLSPAKFRVTFGDFPFTAGFISAHILLCTLNVPAFMAARYRRRKASNEGI